MKRNQNDNNQIVITPYQKWKIQEIKDAKGDDINLDFYSIEIEEMPKKAGTNQKMTDAELAEHIRKNATEFFTTEEVALSAYSNADKQKWNTKNPLGAVMKFQVGGESWIPLPLIGNPDDLSVICTDIKPNSWIYTTVKSPDDQQHPVSGNREFGIQTINQKKYFYIQGADRITGYGDLIENYYDPVTPQNSIFSGANQLWNNVMRNLNDFINNYGGKSKLKYPIFTKRFKWK